MYSESGERAMRPLDPFGDREESPNSAGHGGR